MNYCLIVMKKIVAFFGSAQIKEREKIYKDAMNCAKTLSLNNFKVVTGGYSGIMEAASRGAKEGRGEAIGVISKSFKGRKPNVYLTKKITTKDLYERQKTLIEMADYFIAYEPKVGTLSEVMMVFALRKNGEKVNSPLCLIGKKWLDLMTFLKRKRIFEKNLLKYTFFFEDGKKCSKFLINFKEVSVE